MKKRNQIDKDNLLILNQGRLRGLDVDTITEVDDLATGDYRNMFDCPSTAHNRFDGDQNANQLNGVPVLRIEEKELNQRARHLAHIATLADTSKGGRSLVNTLRSVGKSIREKRCKAGMSRSQLARRVKVDAQFILELETGMLTPEDVFLYVIGNVLKQFESNNTESELNAISHELNSEPDQILSFTGA